MGKSSGSATTSSTSGPPQQFLQAYQDVYNQAKGVSQQPYQQYGGPMVAAFSPSQMAAFGTIQNSQGLAQPYYDQAAAYMGSAATPISPMGFDNVGSLPGTGGQYFDWAGQQAANAAAPISLMDYNIDPYLSPYTEDVTNALSNTFAQNNATQYNQIKGNAAAQGAFGGDREAVAEAQTAQQQDLAQQQTLAGVRQQGFAQANQEFNAQQAADYQRQVAQKQYALSSGQLGLGIGQGMWGEFNTQQQQDVAAQEASAYLQAQAGSGLANLGNLAQNSALSGAQAQMTAGGMQQQLEQQMLNVPYYQFMAQQAYPYQQAGWLSNIAEGLGGASGGTSSTTYPGPSAISQIGGLATAGAGVYGLGKDQGWWGGGGTSASDFNNALGSDWNPWAADGGAIKRAPGGSVGLGVPPEFGGSGIPGMSDSGYIPGASGMGAAPASKSGGLLHSAFSQPVTTQTQSGGGGGGLGDILGLGIKAAGLFLDNGGAVPRGTGLAHGYASGGGPHAAAPMVADLTHVAAPSSFGAPTMESVRPAQNYAPSFDANGYPGALQAVPHGSAVPAPLSIPMSNGILNRAALNPVAASVGLTSAPATGTDTSAAFVPFVDMGANVSGGGGASGGHVGLGGIGRYDDGGPVTPPGGMIDPATVLAEKIKRIQDLESKRLNDTWPSFERLNGTKKYDGGGMVYPDLSQGYIPALQAAKQTMGIPKPPTMPGWHPDQGLSSQSTLDMLKAVKGSGLLSEAMGGAVLPSTTPLQYDDGGGVSPPAMMTAAQGPAQQRALMQQFQGLPTEKLRELAMRYPAGTPQGSAIQRSLQMRQSSPSSYPGGAGPSGPYGPQGDVQPGTTAANGGRMGFAGGGTPVVMDYFSGDTERESAPHQWSYNNPSRGLGVSPETLNILYDHGIAGMTPVERSIATQPSYSERQIIPRATPAMDAAFSAESEAIAGRQMGRGRDDDLLRALGIVRGYQEDTPTWPRVNGMSDAVDWPAGSMARGGGLADGGYPWEDYIEPPPKRPEDERPKPPPTHVGLAAGGSPDVVSGLRALGTSPDTYDVLTAHDFAGRDDLPDADPSTYQPPKTDRVSAPPEAGTFTGGPDSRPMHYAPAGGGWKVADGPAPEGLAAVPQVTSAPGGTNGIVPRGTLSPPPDQPSARPANLMDIITSGEAQSYNSYNRGRAGDSPEGSATWTDKTLAEVMAAQRQGVNAVGKVQAIPSTLRYAVDRMGLSPDTLYNEDTQKKIFGFLMSDQKRPQIQAYITGKSDNPGAATTAVGQEWSAAATYPDAVATGLQGARTAYQSAIGNGASHQQAWDAAMTAQVGTLPTKTGGSGIAGGAPAATLASYNPDGSSSPSAGSSAPTAGAGNDLQSQINDLLKRVSPTKSGGSDLYKSPYLPLIAAGLGMMASRSPFPGVAIGEGGLAGVKALQHQAESVPKNELEQVKAAEARMALELMPLQAQISAGAFLPSRTGSVPVPAAGAPATAGATTIPTSSPPSGTPPADTVIPAASASPAAGSATPAAPSSTPASPPPPGTTRNNTGMLVSTASGGLLPSDYGQPAGTISPERAARNERFRVLDDQIAIAKQMSLLPGQSGVQAQARVTSLLQARNAAENNDPQLQAELTAAKEWAGVAPSIAKAGGEEGARVEPRLAVKRGEMAYEPQEYEVPLPGGSGSMTLLAPRDQVLSGTAPGIRQPITMAQTIPSGAPATKDSRYDPDPESLIAVAPPPGVVAKKIELSDSAKGKLSEDHKTLELYRKTAQEVPLQMVRINDLSELLDATKTGRILEAGQGIAAWAKAAGLGNLIPEGYDPSNAEQINKLSTQLVFSQIKQIGGRVLVSEIDGLSKANPNIALTPEANRAILQNVATEQRLAEDRYLNASKVFSRYKQLGNFDEKYIANTPAGEIEQNIRQQLAPAEPKEATAPPPEYPDAKRGVDGFFYIPNPDKSNTGYPYLRLRPAGQ